MDSPSLPGYENLELIGKGGFSRVYRADQSKLKRKVAVKVLNFGLSDEADRLSFARETELMGRVSTHPNIVTVHDTAFTADGQPCIVMELYPGGSLADLINEVGSLNTREALEVGVAIASALQASHLSGVLHCDLKPQNILISEFGQPALGDFGISTFAEERTRTGKDAGAGFTLPYAAPEIVEGESPTVASDVYSLAATLYTSLCGRRPFAYRTGEGSKPTAAEHARRILLEPVRSLVDEGVPVELDALIRGAMSKEPAERPASAAVFANACHQIGQALGLGTSSPRIADHAALRLVDGPSVGHDPIDLSLVRQRHNFDKADLRAERPAEPPVVEPANPDLTAPASRPPELREREPSADLFAPTTPLIEPVSSSSPTSATRAAQPLSTEPVVVHGASEPLIDPTVLRASFEPEAPEASDQRRRFAVAGAVVAVLAMLGVLFVASRGSGGDQELARPTVTSAVAADAVDPVLAPTQPSDVRLERTEDLGVLVSWQAPEADLASGDVTYEVRREAGGDPWESATDSVTVTGVADDEGVCVTVLALRSNRVSAPTSPECLAPEPVSITVTPAECEGPCRAVLAGAEPGASVELVSRNGQIVDDPSIVVDMVVDSSGEATLAVAEGAPAGDYLVVIRSDDDSTQSLLFRVG